MITPAFSPTATERVLPRLALDFTTGVLDSRVAVTRALNTATRVNSSGLVAVVNADLPRFDYDPATLAPKGLLIEEQRSNLFTYSEQFNNPVWILQNVDANPDATTSPDGTVDADAIIPNTTNTQVHRIFITTAVAAVPHSLSIYAKASGYSWLKLRLGSLYANFNVSTGVAGIAGAGTTSTITNAGNGWYRCTITGTPAASAAVFIYPMTTNNADLDPVSYAGDGTSGIFMWGAQLEAGAFATSYIPTTTTSLTRNADVVSMTGTNFSSWYNASQGAFVVDFDTVMLFPASTAPTQVLSVSDGTSDNRMTIFCYADLVGGQVRQGGATQAELYFSSIPSGVNKAFLAYKTNDVAATLNGVVAQVDTSATIPTVDRMGIGIAPSSAYLNGHVRSVRYFIQRLTNAEGRANTK